MLLGLEVDEEGAGVCFATSSIRFLGDSAERDEGMETVRGVNFPLDAIFGVPISRERTIDVWASIRWRASSMDAVSDAREIRGARTDEEELEFRIGQGPQFQ